MHATRKLNFFLSCPIVSAPIFTFSANYYSFSNSRTQIFQIVPISRTILRTKYDVILSGNGAQNFERNPRVFSLRKTAKICFIKASSHSTFSLKKAWSSKLLKQLPPEAHCLS
jgi:hypothetical protein